MKLVIRAVLVVIILSILYVIMDFINRPVKEIPKYYYDTYKIHCLINEENTCKAPDNTSLQLEMLVVMLSAANKSEARQVIRDTWGKVVREPGRMSKLLFFVADGGEEVNDQIKYESEEYHDIIQFSHLDTYENLTLKSISILKWVHTHCAGAKFIFKADDDMVLNVQNIMTSLRKAYTRSKRFFLCSVKWRSLVIRDKENKWYIPYEDYMSKYYPPYCESAYAFTGEMVLELVLASRKVPLFKWEDVHMTSHIANEILVNRFHHNGIRPHRALNLKKPCLFRYFLVAGGLNMSEIQTLWQNYHTPGVCRR